MTRPQVSPGFEIIAGFKEGGIELTAGVVRYAGAGQVVDVDSNSILFNFLIGVRRAPIE
jgi:hypothetical protein